MTIALEGRIKWRLTAPYHVQIQLDRKSEPSRVPGEFLLQGRVVRVFRSDGRLGNGDQVAFRLWVCQPGDEPTGAAFIYYQPLMQTTYIEAYLHGKPPDCELAGYEFAVIGAPSDEPSMSPEQLQESAGPALMPAVTQSILKKKPWWRRH